MLTPRTLCLSIEKKMFYVWKVEELSVNKCIGFPFLGMILNFVLHLYFSWVELVQTSVVLATEA